MRTKILVTRSSMPKFEEYVEMIRPLWETRWLTNMGDYHNQLEANLKEYLDVPWLSLTVNGHMALELAIQAMDFPEGAEIITTPFTFISTTHAIVRNRLKPVFCDIKLSDYTIDEDKIEKCITEKTVAVLPVHVYGNICNVEKIREIAERYHLKVIYDAAHAFGESVQGMGIGNFGDASIFSFHATKVFHTVEGGAAAFHEEGLYKKFCNLKNFGIQSEENIDEIGTNAKMNEFCAAMGLCNLKYVDEVIRQRGELVNYYMVRLGKIAGVRFCEYDIEKIKYAYPYFPILLKPDICGQGIRDKIYYKLKEQNIYSRKYFYPITADAACFHNEYQKYVLENAIYAGENILALPLYPELRYANIDMITEIIQDTIHLKNEEKMNEKSDFTYWNI
ncbi:MAG: DegT/DnrJ/EryC1/StrS family aminotransferase [Lachnospiraceae bacterium]|nr:DegT/DnrJ/EryC1/StrS family aminotransferase [Lachnospiraceae bacterium]